MINLTRHTILIAQKCTAITLLVVTVLVGAIYIKSQPSLYRSQTRLIIKSRTPVPIQEEKSSVFLPLIQSFNKPLNTASELIKSSLVLDNAADLVRARVPDARQISPSTIGANLQVEIVKDTDILLIKYTDGNAKTAATILQSILDAFLELNKSHTLKNAVQTRVFLEQKLKEVKAKFWQDALDLKEYQLKSGVVEGVKDAQDLRGRAWEMSKAAEESRLTIAKLSRKAQSLASELNERSLGPLSKSFEEDPTTEELRKRIAAYQVHLIELQSKLTNMHPRVQSMQVQIQDAQRALDQRIKYLNSAKAQLPEQVRDEKSQAIQRELSETRGAISAEQTKLQFLLSQSGAVEENLEKIPKHQEKLAHLYRAFEQSGKFLTDIEQRLQMARMLESLTSDISNIQVIDYPQIPSGPFSPNVTLLSAVIVVIGTVLVFGSFFGLARLDPTVRSVSDVLRIMPVEAFPGFGAIPLPSDCAKSFVRMERVCLSLCAQLKRPLAVIVTSPSPGDGKTAVAVSLAHCLAQSGLKTVLVDCNLRNPLLNEVFKIEQSPGVVDYVRASELLSHLINPVETNLAVVPAGKAGLEPYVGECMRPLLACLKAQADAVVIDTPATAEATQALALLQESTHALVVVRIHHTLRRSLRLLSAELARLKPDSVALVVNDTDEDKVYAAQAKETQELQAEPVESSA